MEKIYSVGKLFRIIRIVHAYKQQEFAKELGISQGFVSKIERDSLSPDIDLIINLSRKFNISMDVFKLGCIPSLIEGPGMGKLIPVEFRENGFIRLLVVMTLLGGLNRVVGKKKVEQVLQNLGIKDEVFSLPNLKVNSYFLKCIYSNFDSSIFNRDLYLSICNSMDISFEITQDIEAFVVNESIFKVENVAEDSFYMSVDDSKLLPKVVGKQEVEFLKEFNLAYLNCTFDGKARFSSREADKIQVSLIHE